MRNHTSPLRSVVPTLLAVLAGPLAGQTSVPTSLSIHGYLTQAYGRASGDTVMGLTNQGTTDYRRAAVVARFAPTATSAFVVQLGHRRLGDSPTMRFEENLKVDMAFYEHRFASGPSVRVGKSALPGGIFSEVRYVGTLLPFYRAPYAPYSEGSFVSETIDGAVVSNRFAIGDSWELAADVYGGSFTLLDFAPVVSGTGQPSFDGARSQSKNVLGAQLWLATPMEGLRIGGGGRRKDDYGGIEGEWRSAGRVMTDVNAAIDGSFDKWQLRTEVERVSARYIKATAGYVQLGVSPLHWLTVNVQRELLDVRLADPQRPPLHYRNGDDALGVNFKVDSRTVIKLEQHRTLGFNFEQVLNPYGPRMKGSYFIASVSTSF